MAEDEKAYAFDSMNSTARTSIGITPKGVFWIHGEFIRDAFQEIELLKRDPAGYTVEEANAKCKEIITKAMNLGKEPEVI